MARVKRPADHQLSGPGSLTNRRSAWMTLRAKNSSVAHDRAKHAEIAADRAVADAAPALLSGVCTCQRACDLVWSKMAEHRRETFPRQPKRLLAGDLWPAVGEII